MTSTLSRCLTALTMVIASMSAQAQSAADSTLDTVMKAGVLRACTPGDYKPFSFLKPDGSYEGIDIDLAQSLAAASR
jgi:cyclohexadienyl dehydratase